MSLSPAVAPPSHPMPGALSPAAAADTPMFLRALVHPGIAVFVALAPPILAAVGRSTSSTLAALVPHIAHAVLLALTGVYLYLIVQVPWDLYQVAARRADTLALLESNKSDSFTHLPSRAPTTPNASSKPARHSSSASSSSAAASCTIHATFTLHPPDGPARWLARGAFVMSLAAPVVGSALLLTVKSRLRDAWWIPLDLLDPVPFALAASIRPLLHLAASAARAAAVPLPSAQVPSYTPSGDTLVDSGSAAAAARTCVHSPFSSQQHHNHQHHADPHLHRTPRFSDAHLPDPTEAHIPATWHAPLDPYPSTFRDSSASSNRIPSWISNPPPVSTTTKSIHTHLAALRTHVALHLKHLDAALAASTPTPTTASTTSLSSRPLSSFSGNLFSSFMGSPTAWLSNRLTRPSLSLVSFLPPAPPIRTWLTWLLLGWLRWIVACIVLPLAAWLSMVRATWWVLTLVPKQVIRHAIEAPPLAPLPQPVEARRRRRGSVPANDLTAAEAPVPAVAAADDLDDGRDLGGSTSVVEDTASLVDALLSRVLPAGMYTTTVAAAPLAASKPRHASPGPRRASSKGAGSGNTPRSRTRSRGAARGSLLRPLSAPVVGAVPTEATSSKRPTTVAAL